MKCRKCGNEVDIGEVFCRTCGTAIQIVPDYNPLDFEIEVPVEEKKKETLEEEKRKKQRREQQRKKKQREKVAMITIAVVSVLFFVVALACYIRYQKINSFDYQLSAGMEYYENMEYGSALKCFKSALEASHDEQEEIQVKLTMAECYETLGDYDRMVEILLEVVNTDPSVAYYRQLMAACEKAENTELMNRILKETQGTEVGDALSEYRTGDVTANLPGGEYHDYLSVELTSSQAGSVIYYTLDGSEPTVVSSVYVGPVVIEKIGVTVLRAVAVNEAGLSGEEYKAEYKISLVVPEAPAVTPDSGSYSYSQQIEITVPEGAAAYYTIDGTVPNPDTSALYEGSLTMPIGNTIFSAIIVDKYGVSSQVSKKNYECKIDRAFPYDAAVIKLKNYLVSVGIMSDLNGNRGNGERISVQFVELAEVLVERSRVQEEETSAAEELRECYVFTLRRTVDGETATLSEMLYAVDTEKGDVYTLSLTAEGYVSQPDTTQK